jgi:hypothetical protein
MPIYEVVSTIDQNTLISLHVLISALEDHAFLDQFIPELAQRQLL